MTSGGLVQEPRRLEPESGRLDCDIIGCGDTVEGLLEVLVHDRPGLSFRWEARRLIIGLCAAHMDRAQATVPAVSTAYMNAEGGPWRGGRARRYPR